MYNTGQGTMPATKTKILALRIHPGLKEAIEIAAMRENRNVSNLVELLIKKHLKEVGIPFPDQQALFKDE